MKIQCKRVTSLKEFIDAIRLRVEIFIIEQHCPPGWEPDIEDKVSEHFVAIVNKKIVATVRVRKTSPNEFKIERMVVEKTYRGKGIAKELTQYVLKYIKPFKPKRVWMQAQAYTQRLYEHSGFIVVSKPYDLWNLGIPHVDMELRND